MGWTFMALVLSHCIILYSVATVKSKLMCFAAGLATLASIKLEPYNSWQVRKVQRQSRGRFETSHSVLTAPSGILGDWFL